MAGFINNADVDAAGSVTIQALETVTIRAIDQSTVESKGGSLFKKSKSLAINGVIAENMVLSHQIYLLRKR